MIQNAAREHAFILFKELIGSATDDNRVESIRIVSGHLDTDFYGALVSDIEAYLEKSGASISVVVLDSSVDLSEHPFVKIIDGYQNGEVLQVPTGQDWSKHPHFIIVGNSRFRFETDHAQTKAAASFNGPAIGRTLVELFDGLHDCLTSTQKLATA